MTHYVENVKYLILQLKYCMCYINSVSCVKVFISHEALMSLQETQSDMNDVLSVNNRRLKLVTADLWALSNFPD